MRFKPLVLFSLVTLSGCSSCQSKTLSLNVAGNLGDGYTVTDGGPGGTFTCDTPPGLAPQPRLLCHRGSEELDLILKDTGAVAVQEPTGPKGERRFYRCEGAPESGKPLSCTEKELVRKSPDGKYVSPFPSTVDGVTIHNAHVVQKAADGSPLLLRGMAPLTQDDAKQLVAAGVASVVIYKVPDDSQKEINDEKQRLVQAGLPEASVVNVPMPWKDIKSFAEPCRVTVQALQILQANATAGKKTYFHCTVGEDRTGLLSALHRMLNEPLSARLAFHQEMCEHGYSSGDPGKPYAGVVEAIDRDLTPVFLKMAALVESGKLTRDHLDPAVCDQEPTPTEPVADYVCPTSSLFDL